jgi:ferritin-like metal-binding protein YciE
MKLQTVEDLFLEGLQYAYDTEQQLTQALPKMAQASSTPQLREAFEQHLLETKQQVGRAEQIFQIFGKQPERKPNTVLQAMTQEAENMIKNTDQNPIRDAALIVAGNQVEHFEMASWGSLRTYAELLGKQEAVSLIQKTLDEEKQADAKLTALGENQVNQQALQQGSKAAASA